MTNRETATRANVIFSVREFLLRQFVWLGKPLTRAIKSGKYFTQHRHLLRYINCTCISVLHLNQSSIMQSCTCSLTLNGCPTFCDSKSKGSKYLSILLETQKMSLMFPDHFLSHTLTSHVWQPGTNILDNCWFLFRFLIRTNIFYMNVH